MATPIAVIDAETDEFGARDDHGELIVPVPFIWGFYDGERFREFADAKAMIEYLRDQKLIVYAHNGGRFDFHFLLEFLDAYSDVLIINGRLARFKIGDCEFRDSVCILPIKLSDYKKDEIDYAKLNRKVRHLHMAEIRRYLRQDCVSLFEIVSEFRQKYGNGVTLAGSAMKVWRKMSGEQPPETTEDFYQSISPYYYGGRVECFSAGVFDGTFNAVDINSAYPFAMLHDHPFSASFVERDDVTIYDDIIDQSFYTIDCPSTGAFPFRGKGSLRFPADHVRRRFHVTGWELRAAIDCGMNRGQCKVASRVDFGKAIHFRDYIDHFYAMKKAAKKGTPEYIFAKLFMNSLYGKFGANPENYHNFGIIPANAGAWFTQPERAAKALKKDPTCLHIGKHRPPFHDGKGGEPIGHYWMAAGQLGPWALVAGELTESEKRYYNLATAASITGFVRAHLFRHVQKLRAAGCAPMYCDTDSICFKGKVPPAFALTKELGDWSHEGTFDRVAIAGKKLYAFKCEPEYFKRMLALNPDFKEWKTASKGVQLSAAEIVQVASGATVTYANQVPTFSVHDAPKFGKRRVRKTADKSCQ